jgi:hypothetical protein
VVRKKQVCTHHPLFLASFFFNVLLRIFMLTRYLIPGIRIFSCWDWFGQEVIQEMKTANRRYSHLLKSTQHPRAQAHIKCKSQSQCAHSAGL